MVMQKVLLRTSSISWKKSNLRTSHQPSPHRKTQDRPKSPVPTNYFWTAVESPVAPHAFHSLSGYLNTAYSPCRLIQVQAPSSFISWTYRLGTKPAHQALDDKGYHPLNEQHWPHLHPPDGRSRNTGKEDPQKRKRFFSFFSIIKCLYISLGGDVRFVSSLPFPYLHL